MGKMVSQILQQKETIRLALAAYRSTSHLIPTWQDVYVLESIDKALSPLHELTSALCGEKYVTVSAVIPMIELLKSKTLKVDPADSQLTRSLKNLIEDDLSQRYMDDEVMSLLDITSVLDPRFKVKYVRKIDDALARVKEEGTIIVRHCQEQQHQSTQPSSPAVSVTEQSEPPRKKKSLGTLFKIYEDEEEGSRFISPEQIFDTELERYLSLPKLDSEEEILPWWKTYNSQYPHIFAN